METAKKQPGALGDGLPMPAVDDLYRDHVDWLRDVARRRLRLQPADVEDVVQDTYLRLSQQQTAEVRRPRALLAQIALNLFRDGRRRLAVRDAHSVSVRLQEPSVDTGALTEQETRLQLEQVILALPEPQRDVFVLSRFRQMSNREIAEHLGISIKTVEWRMSRALDFCISRFRD